jgi:copper transport protein
VVSGAVLVRIVAGACVLALVVPAVASAHAQLEETSPQRGARVAAAPGLVSFRFNEPVEGSFGAVRVFTAEGGRVDAGDAFHPGGSGPMLAVHLRPGLHDGVYTATYRVISADGHPVSGGFVFTVGSGGAAPRQTVAQLAGRAGAGPVTATAFAVVRAVQYAAIALGLGGLLFLLVVWLPALRGAGEASAGWRDGSHRFVARVRWLLGAAAVAGVVSACAGVVLEGATAASTSAWGALSSTVIRETVSTRFGTVWGAAALIWLAAGATAAAGLRLGARRAPVLVPAELGATGVAVPRTPALLWVALGTVALLTLVPALAGHASTQSPTALVFPANVAHVVAASVWVGGLVVLLFAVPAATAALEPPKRSGLLAALLARFSPVALLSVAILLATGVVQGVVEVASFAHLLDTAFGRAVLIKLVLLGALVGLGAYNRQRSVPRLRVAAAREQPPGRSGVRLRTALRGEVALVGAALAVTGALSGYAPSTASGTGPFSTTRTLGALQLQVTLDPARVGSNELHLYLLDARTGAPFRRARQLTVSASLPAKDIGPLPQTPQVAGPGHYVVQNAVLGVRGRWRLALGVRTSAFDETTTDVEVPVR